MFEGLDLLKCVGDREGLEKKECLCLFRVQYESPYKRVWLPRFEKSSTFVSKSKLLFHTCKTQPSPTFCR